MDFTEPFRGKGATFSPDGRHILATYDQWLVVRRADTLELTHSWQIDGSSSSANAGSSAKQSAAFTSASSSKSSNDTTQCAWSCDSRYLFAARGTVVQVFDVLSREWNASIQAGIEGLTRVVWAPDGRSLLCFSDWALRVTIWSLVTGKSIYIQFPKYSGRAYAFSDDGRYSVLAERHKSRDTMGIYDARNEYKLLRHFALPTASIASFSLSPDARHIAIWESPLEYKLYVLDLRGGVVGSFTPESDPGQGIRCVAWHPSGEMIAVGGWDDKFYILDTLSFRPIISFDLRSRVTANVMLWREPTGWLEATHGRGLISYDRIATPTTILTKAASVPATTTGSSSGAGTRTGGVVQLEWNLTGSLLLARWEHCAEAVHIYAFPRGREGGEYRPGLRTVLQQRGAVRSARWDAVRGESLVLSTGDGALYMWRDASADWVGGDEEIAECVGIPAKGFTTLDAQWGADDRSMVIQDRTTFACAFVVDEGGDGAGAEDGVRGYEGRAVR